MTRLHFLNFNLKLLKGILIFAFCILLFKLPVVAQVPLNEQINTQGPQYVGATYAVTRLETVIMGFITIILIIASIIFFICLVWSGIQWQLSRGDQSGITAARSRMTNCLLGFAIVSLALAFQIIIQYFFGVKIFPV